MKGISVRKKRFRARENGADGSEKEVESLDAQADAEASSEEAETDKADGEDDDADAEDEADDENSADEDSGKLEEWRKHARKWQTLAKKNLKRINELEEHIKRLSGMKETELAEALAPLQKQLERFKHEDQVRDWKNQVAQKTRVPAAVLRGSSLAEIEEHGEELAKYYAEAVKGPAFRDAGEAPKRGETSSDARNFVRALFSE